MRIYSITRRKGHVGISVPIRLLISVHKLIKLPYFTPSMPILNTDTSFGISQLYEDFRPYLYNGWPKRTYHIKAIGISAIIILSNTIGQSSKLHKTRFLRSPRSCMHWRPFNRIFFPVPQWVKSINYFFKMFLGDTTTYYFERQSYDIQCKNGSQKTIF